MGKEIDPADIGKHPDLIKKAQAEIAQCDVLVCGRCHTVFHLIELFREHKEKEPECKRSSTSPLHDCDEAQTKVWAFLLWKSTQQNAPTPGATNEKAGSGNSWKLYQTWVKLDDSVRDTWVVAGKTIQSFGKTGSGSLHEMPVKITKTIVEKTDEQKPGTPAGVNAQNRVITPVRKPGDVKTSPGLLDPKSRTPGVGGGVVGAVKKPDVPVKPGTVPGKRSIAKRTHPKTGEVTEEEVEKILAKRFSPGIKMHEYLVKWSKMTNEHNTWEPLTHLHSCQSVLEYFEVQLAKQKEQRAAAAARALQQQRQEKAKGPGSGPGTPAGATGTNATQSAGSSPLSPSNAMRPNRVSKTNAVDRVKLWSSGNQDGSSEEGGIKRKLDDSENDAATDQDGSESPKKMRTDSNSAINDALNKVSQSSSVKIVSVSATGAGIKASPGGSATVNGGTGSPSSATVKDSNAAEVVIIKSPKDGVPSGISKKPVGMLAGGGTAINRGVLLRGEAKVKIVPKSEPGGIFKIKPETSSQASQQQQQQQGGSPASGSTTSTSSNSTVVTSSATTPRPVTIHSSSTLAASDSSSGVTTRFIRRNVDGTPQIVRQTIRKAPKVVSSTPGLQRQGIPAGRPIGSAPSTPLGASRPAGTASGAQQRSSLTPRVGSTIAPRPVTRVVPGTPSNVVRTATASSEQKLNALRKQGVNVVKHVVTTSSTKTKPSNDDEDDGMMNDGFPSNLPLPTPPSPPRALTLCPVTGKVLGQAEGEPTPVPSPENESEEKKPGAVKKEEADQQQRASGSEAAETDQQQLVVAGGGDQTDMQVQQLMTNEDGSPIIVAGEDGTLYQVAGKNAEGQTILIAQGADGEQSCVLVTSQEGEEEAQPGTAGVLTLDAAVSEAVAVPQEGQQLTEEQAAQYQQAVDTNQQLTIQTEDSQDGQITAEVVQADQPSPGGTRRVVLLLPDGSFMMTEVNDEQYQSLNLVN
ncbi:mucin-19 [Anopheles ziemanni]|uniref:mucin-19 n=1 Tax=Anopheles coustani TaxID=139045 RepID=UPI002657EF95|nr:mucin-19 [Anopheles coustani]XP_058174521.1 mucin-19 [Anopheles ziemanni]